MFHKLRNIFKYKRKVYINKVYAIKITNKNSHQVEGVSVLCAGKNLYLPNLGLQEGVIIEYLDSSFRYTQFLTELIANNKTIDCMRFDTNSDVQFRNMQFFLREYMTANTQSNCELVDVNITKSKRNGEDILVLYKDIDINSNTEFVLPCIEANSSVTIRMFDKLNTKKYEF